MAVTRLLSLETNTRVAQLFIESAQTVGEEVIVFHMFHEQADRATIPKCSVCYDQVYKQTDTDQCTNCWGTGFEGGIKNESRAWAIITEDNNDESANRTGTWETDDRMMQIEAAPTVWQHDYIVRVRQWNPDHSPAAIYDVYMCGPMQEKTLRTGGGMGQSGFDKMATVGSIHVLAYNHVFRKFPIVPTVSIPRLTNPPY